MCEARPGIGNLESPRVGWLLYDGSCNLCNRWVRFARSVLEKRGVQFVPLQSSFAQERLGLDRLELIKDLHLNLVNGVVLRGARAYRHLLRQVWWTWPIYALSCLPGLRTLFDKAYRRIADNRK